MKCNILIIGNEIRVAQELQGILENQGAFVEVAYNEEHGIINAQSSTYDLIILDHVLAQDSELLVIKKLREGNRETPVFVLVSTKDAKYIPIYLEAGVNGYIIKPLSLKEILEKVKSILSSKKHAVIAKTVSYGDIELNLEQKILTCDGKTVLLPKKEYQIMTLFLYSPEQIFSKNVIIEKFWGEYSGLENNNIEVHLSLLRKKLKSINTKTTIRTVRGVGYALTLNA